MTTDEMKSRLRDLAGQVDCIANEYGGGVAAEAEAWPRDQLVYDLHSATNVIRKTAKRLARGVMLSPEEEIEKLRAELREKRDA